MASISSNLNNKIILFMFLLFSLLLTLTYHYSKFQINYNIIRNCETVENLKYEQVTEMYTELTWRKSQMDEECFHYLIYDNRTFLPNILEHSKQPNENSKNIFFHETSCIRDGVIKLNARQACAIESAAKMNPDWDVFVLFTARVGFNNKTRLPLFDQLSSYPNIHLCHVNINSFTEDTPIGEWISSGILFTSSYFTAHLADTLRLVSLWKYGGTYMDLDVIVKKSLNPLESNFAGEESANYIANGVLNFDNCNGHKIVDMCLRELIHTFNGQIWGNNGPALITRVLERVCRTNTTIDMNRFNCNGFQVFRQEVFYAIPYQSFALFFGEEAALAEVLDKTENSTIVHLWNKLSVNETVKVGSRVAYGVLANDYCPKVYSNSGEYF